MWMCALFVWKLVQETASAEMSSPTETVHDRALFLYKNCGTKPMCSLYGCSGGITDSTTTVSTTATAVNTTDSESGNRQQDNTMLISKAM